MKRIQSVLCAAMIAVLACASALADEPDRIDMFDDAYMQEYGLCDAKGRLYFQSMDWDGSTCYAYLTDMAVYTCEPGGAPQKLCTLPSEPENFYLLNGALNDDELAQLYETVTYIVADRGVLYGYNVYSGAWGVIDANGIHWDENLLDFSCLFHEDDFYPDRVVRSFMTDQELVVLANAWDDTNMDFMYVLYSFNLTTGESGKYDVEGLYGACRGADGELLCLLYQDEMYSLCTLDLTSGKTTPVDVAVDMKEPGDDYLVGLGGLAYDANTDAIYLSANGKVYRSLRGESFEPISQVKTDGIVCETRAWTLPDGRYVILLDGMHIRGEDGIVEDTVNDRQLTICGDVPLSAMNLYRQRYPDITLNFKEQVSADALVTGIITQDDAVDIYVLQADYTFSSMKNKQLAASLSDSEIITADVGQMYDEIQRVLCDDAGNVVAYPQELMLWRYGINEGYWHMLWPDRPLPETFDEVLDAWIDWERNVSQDYPGLGFISEGFDYEQWIEEILRIYVMQHDTGELPELDAQPLKSALEKLREVCEIRVSEGRGVHGEPDPQIADFGETGPGFILWNTLKDAMVADSPVTMETKDDYLYGLPKGDFTWLPLTFDANSLKNTDGRMAVYVVNPYSRHKDEALRLIECLTEPEVSTYLYYALHPNINTPLEDPDYEETRARYTEMRDMYQKAIEAAQADGSDTEELEFEFRFYDAWLAEDSYRWKLSPETISQYRERLLEKPLNVHAESPYIAAGDTTALDYIRSAISRYADGNLSLDAMLREISSKVQMIYAENQ